MPRGVIILVLILLLLIGGMVLLSRSVTEQPAQTIETEVTANAASQ